MTVVPVYIYTPSPHFGSHYDSLIVIGQCPTCCGSTRFLVSDRENPFENRRCDCGAIFDLDMQSASPPPDLFVMPTAESLSSPFATKRANDFGLPQEAIRFRAYAEGVIPKKKTRKRKR